MTAFGPNKLDFELSGQPSTDRPDIPAFQRAFLPYQPTLIPVDQQAGVLS